MCKKKAVGNDKDSAKKKTLVKKKITKKPSKGKKTKKKRINYTGTAAGLFIVCIILMTVFFYSKPLREKNQENLEQNNSLHREKTETQDSGGGGASVQNPISDNSTAETKAVKKNEKTSIPKKEIDVNPKSGVSDTVKKTQTSEESNGVTAKSPKNVEKNTRNESLIKNKPKKVITNENVTEENGTVETFAVAPPIKDLPKLPEKGQLIFVFDDAGHNLEQLQFFLDLPFPCTIAVLPRLAKSSEAARKIREAGKELILHQPMQAENLQVEPGEGAIQPGMNAEQIRETILKNIEEIAPIAGMNNHEGSLITSDETAMLTVLEICRECGIYFLDSRTTSKSAAPAAAKKLNMQIWERAVFLDNEKHKEYLQKQIAIGLETAAIKGSAIMIGHIFTPELAIILKDMYPDLVKEGYKFSTISKMNKGK